MKKLFALLALSGAVALPAVPQYLVPLRAEARSPRMAGAALRDASGPAI
mgnify:CR=1 FL=1